MAEAKRKFMKNTFLLMTLSLTGLMVAETGLAKCYAGDPPEYHDCKGDLPAGPQIKALKCFSEKDQSLVGTFYENYPSIGLVSGKEPDSMKFQLQETVSEIS